MADFRLTKTRHKTRTVILAGSLLALAACGDGLDLDLRGGLGGLDTSEAAKAATPGRPDPDDRGVISYPNFQVAVARRGDTLRDVATRVGLPAAELARYNGITEDTTLRNGEVIALPKRVAEPSPETGAATSGPIMPPGGEIDITTLAGNALDRADAERPATPRSPFQSKPAPVATGNEPIQHQVRRGETAYSISRLYNVSVRSLGDWNGLGPNLTVREGQFLLIPVAADASQVTSPAPLEPDGVTVPGQGSPTPVPPSASQPLPEPAPVETVVAPPSPNLEEERTAASGTSKMLLPVTGKIIRGYEKDKTDGIDIAAQAGTAVRAAADGVVAAITRNTDQVPILVIRHSDNFLTVYANIDNIKVNKDDPITRGQNIATVRGSGDSFLHFEVRRGIDSVDPVPFLN